jgi:hypothetical protein
MKAGVGLEKYRLYKEHSCTTKLHKQMCLNGKYFSKSNVLLVDSVEEVQ